MRKIIVILTFISFFTFFSCEKYEYNFREIEKSIPYPVISNFDVHHYQDYQIYYSCEINNNVESEDPYTLIWDFGDSNTSTNKNGYHSYSSYGDYTVTLTVTNKMGDVVNTQNVSVYKTY